MDNKKFLIIGGSGYVGSEFSKQLNTQGILTHSLSRSTGFDIFNNIDDISSLKHLNFNGIIFLAPVAGLIDQPTLELRNFFNAKIEKIFQQLSKISDKRIIFISSNHVFSGADGPYKATATPDGVTWFSHAKQASERQCYKFFENAVVVRASMLLDEGFSSAFFSWIRGSLSKNIPISIRSDIIGSPTLVSSMVTDCINLIERDSNPEPIHLSNGIQSSKYEIAISYAEKIGLDVELIHRDQYDAAYPVSPGNYCLISNYAGKTEASASLVSILLGRKF